MNKTAILICALLTTVLCTGGVQDVEINNIPTPMPGMPGASMVGGIHSYRFDSVGNPEDRMAQEKSIAHILTELENVEGLEFVEVVSATVQIVAGKKYNIVLKFSDKDGQDRFFNIEIWLKIWENFSQVTKAAEIPASEVVVPTQPTMVGGMVPRELDIVNNANDARVYNKVVEHSKNVLGGDVESFVVKGTSNVFTQLVAGTIYTFDITFGKEGTADEDITFNVRVILIPWQDICDVLSIVEKQATPELSDTGAYGSGMPYTFDIENNPVDKLIFGAVHAKVLATLGAEVSRWEFVQIRHATRQIVSGSIYNFEIVYGDANGNDRIYFASVYVVPWENKLEINEFRLVH